MEKWEHEGRYEVKMGKADLLAPAPKTLEIGPYQTKIFALVPIARTGLAGADVR
jgi:hypothetical protein